MHQETSWLYGAFTSSHLKGSCFIYKKLFIAAVDSKKGDKLEMFYCLPQVGSEKEVYELIDQ